MSSNVDFKKSTTSENVEKFFMRLIKKHILEAYEIDLRPILKEVYQFKDVIKETIENGETTYLPNASAKEFEAYANPESNQALKGIMAWNALMPDQQVSLPAKVSILKLNIFKESDIEDLQETNPKIYNILIDKIFHDETGMFVKSTWENDRVSKVNPRKKEWYNDIPKKYRAKYKKLGVAEWNAFAESYTGEQVDGHYEYKIQGLANLSIPTGGKIPEWILPYVDYETVINNIISPFVPVLEAFGMRPIETGKSSNGINRKTNSISNIVKF